MEIDYSSLVNIRSPYSQFLDLHNPILYAVSKMVSRITSVLVLFFLRGVHTPCFDVCLQFPKLLNCLWSTCLWCITILYRQLLETFLEPARTSGNCPFYKALLPQSPVTSGTHDSDPGFSVRSQVRLCSPALSPKVLPKLCPFLLLFPHTLKCRASSPRDP